MSLFIDIVSWVFILLGSFFTVVGGLGILRMPDVFTRMHAVSLIDSLGFGLLILGMVLQAGPSLIAVKLLMLLALVFFTWPVVTHAMAQVCMQEGITPVLAEDRREIADSDQGAESGRQP